jgi:uncharacterized protein
MSKPRETEIRNISFETSKLQLRTIDNNKRIITGYFAVFNQSTDMGWFSERVMPGAFTKTLKENDIRGLINHDANLILGRNKVGTLSLKEDDIGLYGEIQDPDTSYSRDLIKSLERGDIDQASFGFWTINDSWHIQDGKDVRDLVELKLLEVTVATFGQYTQTKIGVRDLFSETKINYDEFRSSLLKIRVGKPLTQEERALIKEAAIFLRDYGPSDGNHSMQIEPSHDTQDQRSLTLLEKELELLEIEYK